MPPLIYIHQGYSWYIPVCLDNARHFHSGDIVFIGDAFAGKVSRLHGVEYARLSGFLEGARAFQPHYRHHSSLGADFELFCIQRWFILRDFMRARGLSACVYLDTDILLTTDLTPYVAETRDFGLTFTGYSAHICFVNRLEALERFCDFVVSVYTSEDWAGRLTAWQKKMVAEIGAGGVSDMTLFYWFQREHPRLVGDYDSIFNPSPFDVSLDDPKGWVSDTNGYKQIHWDGATPHGIRGKDGKRIPFAILHHQGTSKSLLFDNAQKILGGKPRLAFETKLLHALYRAGSKVGLLR